MNLKFRERIFTDGCPKHIVKEHSVNEEGINNVAIRS